MKSNLALIIPLMLTACADNQSFIGGNSYNPSYLPGEQALYGPIQTFVRGGPYPNLKATDETGAVIAAMQDGGFYNTKFTTETVGRSPYRVLMVFNPTPGTGLEQLCEIDARTIQSLPAAPSSDGRIGLAAVFCRAGELMGGANGTLPVAVAANDPVVKGSIQAFMRQIFPATNPTQGGGAGNDPP
ncbi:MAG: hypothetical protein JWO51_2859 [Rhodospirillales bacterium]|nr:hypothetical protein [Rhodospirillales bacterium]